MGDYTELRFGAKLKKEIPKEAIEAIEYLINDFHKGIKPPPTNFPFNLSSRITMVVSSSLSYFDGKGLCEFTKDKDNTYYLKIRSSIKNYCKTIELFLSWIKPYVEKGLGAENEFAIVTYEYSKNGGESEFYYSDKDLFIEKCFYDDYGSEKFDFPREYK